MTPDSPGPGRRLRAQVPGHRLTVAGLAALAAVLVWAVSTQVFPYHSVNHDEAVYLQQAAMLLEGKLALSPPVPEAFRPWFFVRDGATFYPKYAPVPAAMFAVGTLVGSARLALAALAAAAVALTAGVVSEAFDRPTGRVAAALLVASPLFLVDAGVFLPYVPTLVLNLAFAWAYLRAARTGHLGTAAVAGAAAGLAFFARPYTAVLFAAPFVAHGLWTLRPEGRPALRRNLVTAAFGLAGVVIALSYNAYVTGAPLTFPYEAFAPLDGLGFGRRALLGHDVRYTPELALRAGAAALAEYLTRWTVAAPLGSLLAALGLGLALRRWRRRPAPRQVAVAGLLVSVPIGQLYFWGSLNAQGSLADPADGLVHFLGPYYHVALLLPTVAFAAIALRWLAGRLRPALAPTGEVTAGRALAAALVVLAALAGGWLAVAAVADPVSDNRGVTEQYAAAYDPIERARLEDALVFLPTPYGDWLNHPFQALRNDPGYDGDVVYALRERQFAVTEAFPDRRAYRYVYRGAWLPYGGPPVDAHLQRVRRVTGERVRLQVSAGVPAATDLVSARVTGGGAAGYATVTDPGESLPLTVVAGPEIARVTSPALAEPIRVPVEGDGIRLRLFVDYGHGRGFSYVLDLPLTRSGGQVTALTPVRQVCARPPRCGAAAAYVPGSHRPGVSLNASLAAAGAAGPASG